MTQSTSVSSSRILVSAALLNVNADDGQDYIDRFVPLVLAVAPTVPPGDFTVGRAQQRIAEEFSLHIPAGAISTILGRAVRKKLLRKAHATYTLTSENVDGGSLAARRQDVLRQHETLCRGLSHFASDRFLLEWGADDADNHLHAFLESRAADVLRAVVGGRELAVDRPEADTYRYVVAAFIDWVVKHDADLFKYLVTVVKGSMLAGALLSPELGGVQRRFRSTDLFFDTGFVMQSLGWEGPEAQAPRTELLDLLFELGANIRILQHTVDEIRSVLSYDISALRGQVKHASGQTLRYFFENGFTANDVEVLYASLETLLSGARYRIVDDPDHIAQYTIDEELLSETYRRIVKQQRDGARLNDVMSVTSVFTMRRGFTSKRIEECRSLFVTTNTALIKATKQFFSREYPAYSDLDTVPVMVSADTVTTIAWLKRPQKAADLPVKRLIADIYIALNPANGFWDRCIEEIDRLESRGGISAESYEVVRYSAAARRTLMDQTIGGIREPTEEMIKDAIASAEAAARAPVEEKLASVTKELEEQRRLERVTSAANGGKDGAGAKELEAVVHTLSEDLNTVRGVMARQDARITEIGNSVGRWCARAVFAIGALVILAGSLLGLGYIAIPSGLWGLLAWAIIVVAILAGAANAVFGGSVSGLSRKIETNSSKWVSRRLSSLFKV